MANFLLFALCGIVVLGIIIVGLFSLIVFIEAIMGTDYTNNDFWKDS